MNPREETEKVSRGEKDKAASTSGTIPKGSRESSRNDNGHNYKRNTSRIIHNSNTGSVLNLSKFISADKPTDQSSGARPKEVQYADYNRRPGRRGSVDNGIYRLHDRPKKTYQASRKEMPSSTHTETHATKSQDAVTRQVQSAIYNRRSGRRGSVDDGIYRLHDIPKKNYQASRKEMTSSTHTETRAVKSEDAVKRRENNPNNRNPEQSNTNNTKDLQTGEMKHRTQRPLSNKFENSTQKDRTNRRDRKPGRLQDREQMGNSKGKKEPKESGENRKSINHKENRQPKKHQGKTTYLYVVIGEEVAKTSDVISFLQHRMGNPKALDFQLLNDSEKKTSQNKCNFITMKFESFNKASVARQLLHTSNKNTSSKIRCFFEKEEAEGQIIDKSKERKCKLEDALSDIVETALKASDKHKAKILALRLKLSNVEKEMGKRRGISLSEFEKFSNEKLAFEDKLEELEGQHKEFTKYMEDTRMKLTQLIGCDKFERELHKIRKEFGVECRRLENALPMYARRKDILSVIKHNQVCVILGETGSGKSTQMAQYIYQSGFADGGLIACTQPRKIAAINLATRVASELATGVGQEVGYKVGMQSKMSAITKVLFMTDHTLLNECLNDEVLAKYSCILIDEAHERSIYTDLLLGMLKKALDERPDLNIIITSATIDPDIFVDYFGGIDLCPVLKVSGRTFPVEIFWEHDSYVQSSFPDDYETKALNKAIEIHQSEEIEEGDILVFLTSGIETERCTERLKNRLGEADVLCLQLHGRLKAEEQQLVFKATPPRKRKIVFATNSAETSITIPGIKFVVDSGVVKEMRFDPKKNKNSLDMVPVSQSSANQRKGRAGRTARGVCYRLYTQSDYKKMNKMSSPEILRIQVSQALLKLMELGVDPMIFDYVQSPSNEAMKSALSELTNVGAVHETGITDLGRWIAKLPVEPRLGVFIKKGIDLDISTEALVVASCCNQSGIFFRVGSKEEKEAADMKKMKFCHLGGDLLTMLNVYREWDKVQERAKGKWCQTNSINGKAMKSVRETTNEIITSLKKELDIKIKHNFRNPGDADILVKKLVFECMYSNLGYYLGHESAGYLVVNRLQRVQIHPSSSVMSLGSQPGWVVFNKILNTSTDFMTEVTPVSNELLSEAVEEGKLCLDMKSLEGQKVHSLLKIPVGKHVYWKLVSSMHKMRRQIEEDITAACDNSLIVVEVNKQRGEVSLFCLPVNKAQASAMLLSFVESLHQQLLYESREEFIGSEDSGVRALLRLGGAAVDILMPNEFRSLNIKQNECSRYDLDEESLKASFEFYGPVEQMWRPIGKMQYNSPFWGRVTFTNEVDAVTAFECINEDTDLDISLIPIKYQYQKSSSQQGFTMKVTWCRRPAKDHCFIFLERPEDAALLFGSACTINGKTVQIELSRKNSDLMVKGVMPDVTEEQVKAGLARVLDLSPNTYQHRFRAIIPRINTYFIAGDWRDKNELLASKVSRYARRDTFRVNVLEYKEKTVTAIAFVTFSDPQVCHATAQQMIRDEITINGNKLNVSTECKSTVHIKRRLYDAVAEDIENLIDVYKQKNSSTLMEVRCLKSGNISLDIKAISPEKLAKIKVRVDRIVGGDILECGEKENIQALFCSHGRKLTKDIEKATGTMVFVDERQMKVTIQGRERSRVRAVEMINDFISKQKESMEVEVRLKGEENPPGLLKALLVKYGVKFEELKKETKISGMKINLRYHEISITGTEEAVKLAMEKITEVRDDITKRDKAIVVEREMPDCPICLCPVEETDMYRLEYCGHAYCKICVRSQIQNAISDRKLPIVCAAEDCNKPFVIRDINVHIKMGNIKKKELLDAAVECLVAEKNESFRFCITPNCEVVYRTTPDGTRFSCPVCHAHICTSCHIDFHDGLTCAMYRSAKTDGGSVLKWVNESPEKRKMCPKCMIGIEKIEGCDHMKCKCGAHICWKCLQYFSSGNKCYGHLNEAHGSFI